MKLKHLFTQGLFRVQLLTELAVSGSDLYMGGRFTGTDDGSLTDLGRIARCIPVVNVYLPLVFVKRARPRTWDRDSPDAGIYCLQVASRVIHCFP